MNEMVRRFAGYSLSPRKPNAEPAMKTSQAQIALYENDVPDFIEAELVRLYKALYSSLAYFRAIGFPEKVSTYVARQGETIRAVFLFVREASVIRVLNEAMDLEPEEVRRFASYVFSSFPAVQAIAFHAVRTGPEPLACIHQRFFCAEDFIVDLPDTVDAYIASLGSATRKNIKRHRNRIERDFPSFRFIVREGSEVSEQDLRTVMELNRARMTKKKKTSSIDEATAQEIIRMVRECGVVFLVAIDGRIRAGAITFRIGDNFISRVNAHDPALDGYRLGMVCCFLAICTSIERGGKRFHLGQGTYEYKCALGGVFHGYDHLNLFRSRMSMLATAKLVSKTALAGYRLRANRWVLHGVENPQTRFWEIMRKAIAGWRRLKQMRAPSA